jgi:ElaB/YqjD/DUF883 family membrane-anchored ribosome-binding protein
MHRNSHYEEQAEDFGREVGRRADALHDAAGSRARELAHQAGDQARRVKAQAREWADRGAQRARDGANLVHEEALAAARRANRYVHDQPVKTAVAAAADRWLAGLAAARAAALSLQTRPGWCPTSLVPSVPQ